MANHNSFLELLVEAAVEIPNKPGAFCIDSQALRTLLFELVRTQRKASEGSNTNLKVANEKLEQEMSDVQFHMQQMEKKLDQMGGLTDSLQRLEDVIGEIRENERIISDSTNLLIEDVETVQEQMDSILGKGAADPIALSELADRIEALESKTSQKKPSGSNKFKQRSTSNGRKPAIKKRSSTVDEIRINMSSLTEKLAEPLPPEPKNDLAAPFMVLKEKVTTLGMERVSAVEDFLSALKATNSVQPKMLQELLVIFSGMEVDLFTLLVHAMNEHPSLTVRAFTEILDLMLTSPCNAPAMVALYNAVAPPTPQQPQQPPPPPKLPLDTFCAMLGCAKDSAKVTPMSLSKLVGILIKCDGLVEFLKNITQLESYSWKGILNIMEEIHFSKNSTLLEMVVIMEKMSASALNELMSMLLTIPGYVNELILSLPQPPTLSTQRLLEHLISLPDESPRLLAQTVELMLSKSWLKDSVLGMMHHLLMLTTSLETTRRADSGFFQLLKKLYESGKVSLDHVGELLSLIRNSGAFTMEAVRSMVQFSRDSKNDFVGALQGLLESLMDCPAMKGELIQRLMRLLEKAKFVNPSIIEELLVIMQQCELLRQDNFDPVVEAFRSTELCSPYVLGDFLSTIKQLEFLTLEDLMHVLDQNQQACRKAYDEALERQQRRLAEIKAAQQREERDEDLTEQEEPGVSLEEEKLEEKEEEGEEEGEEDAKEEDTKTDSRDQSYLQIDASMSSASTQAKQVVGVDSAMIQELQKEIKDLQASINALREDKDREKEKARKEKEARRQEKEKRRKKEEQQQQQQQQQQQRQDQHQQQQTQDQHQQQQTQQTEEQQQQQQQQQQLQLLHTTHSVPIVAPSDSQDPSPTGGTDELSIEISRMRSSESSFCLDYQAYLMKLETELKEEINTLKDRLECISQHNEEKCKRRYEILSEMMSVKAETEELTRFEAAVKRQLHNFATKTPPGPAGTKQCLSVHCISCDKKGAVSVKSPEHSLPMQGAFPPVMTQRPHRVYEMDVIRRHARSLLEGNGERTDLYNLPRSCGGQHTSVDVRQTWTYEIHQKESSVRASDGRVYCNVTSQATGSKSKKPVKLDPLPVPPAPTPTCDDPTITTTTTTADAATDNDNNNYHHLRHLRHLRR